MNKLRTQSDTTYPIFFLMVDSTDHITGKTGLSPTVTISKNGGSFASPSGAVSEVGNGLYKIAGNATDSNTVGELWIHATGTGADPTDTSYTIVAYDPFDSVRLGLTALPNAAAEAAGGLYTRGSGAGQINQPANGQIDVNTVKVGGTVQTGRDIGASVLLSPGTGTGQVDITSGVVKSNMTQIDGLATNGYNATLNLAALRIQSVNQAPVQVSVSSAPSDTSAIILQSYGSAAPLRLVGLDFNGNSIVLENVGGTVKGKISGHLNGDVVGSVGSLAAQAKADVNAEVKDVIEIDTQAEPTSPPSSTSSLRDKIEWVFTLWKNKRTSTSSLETVFGDDGVTPISTSTKSDAGGMFTKGKFQ